MYEQIYRTPFLSVIGNIIVGICIAFYAYEFGKKFDIPVKIYKYCPFLFPFEIASFVFFSLPNKGILKCAHVEWYLGFLILLQEA